MSKPGSARASPGPSDLAVLLRQVLKTVPRFSYELGIEALQTIRLLDKEAYRIVNHNVQKATLYCTFWQPEVRANVIRTGFIHRRYPGLQELRIRFEGRTSRASLNAIHRYIASYLEAAGPALRSVRKLTLIALDSNVDIVSADTLCDLLTALPSVSDLIIQDGIQKCQLIAPSAWAALEAAQNLSSLGINVQRGTHVSMDSHSLLASLQRLPKLRHLQLNCTEAGAEPASDPRVNALGPIERLLPRIAAMLPNLTSLHLGPDDPQPQELVRLVDQEHVVLPALRHFSFQPPCSLLQHYPHAGSDLGLSKQARPPNAEMAVSVGFMHVLLRLMPALETFGPPPESQQLNGASLHNWRLLLDLSSDVYAAHINLSAKQAAAAMALIKRSAAAAAAGGAAAAFSGDPSLAHHLTLQLTEPEPALSHLLGSAPHPDIGRVVITGLAARKPKDTLSRLAAAAPRLNAALPGITTLEVCFSAPPGGQERRPDATLARDDAVMQCATDAVAALAMGARALRKLRVNFIPGSRQYADLEGYESCVLRECGLDTHKVASFVVRVTALCVRVAQATPCSTFEFGGCLPLGAVKPLKQLLRDLCARDIDVGR